MDDVSQIVQEIKEGVAETMTPAITKDVMEKLEAKMKAEKPAYASEKQELKASQKESVENFKSLYAELKNGAKTVTKQLNTGTDTEGAEWTPEYFQSEVLRIQEVNGIARNDCRIVPMRGKTETFPTADSISVSRVDEMGKIPVTQPDSGSVKLTAKKLAAIIPMSRELLEYSNVMVVDLIAQLAGEAMSRAEDYWMFRGLANGEGLFQNADIPVYILGAGKTSFGDVTYADLIKAQSLVNDDAFNEGLRYYLSRTVLNSLREELISESSNNLASALQAIALPNLATLPYTTSSQLPRTSADDQEGEIFMGLYNLRHVLMGDARSYELELSREATINTAEGQTAINLWEQDMVAIRVMESIDFAVSNPAKAFVNISTAGDLS